jgi:hypothetical protein
MFFFSAFFVFCIVFDNAATLSSFDQHLFKKVRSVKYKGKFRPITGHEGPDWEYRLSSTLSLTSDLDEVIV